MARGRWLVVLGLAGLLAGFLFYTSRLTRTGPPPEAPLVPEAPGTVPLAPPQSSSPAQPASLGPFTQSSQCLQCHSQIFTEWRGDQHSTSWSEENFKTFTENHTRLECLSCHAPQPMLETGIASNEPKLRDASRVDGVDCLVCHLKDGKTHGTLGSGAACGGVREPALKTSQACFHCHATHNLFKEYLDTAYAKRGVTCQDCHMEKVTRPVADGGKPRETRKHLFHSGGHDTEALKKVLNLDLRVSGGELTVTVTNIGAAHGVPGEINNRVVRLIVSVLVPMPGAAAEANWEEREAYQAFFQAPPRLARDKIPSTQILPGEPRVLKYKLPASKGKVEATLNYLLEKQTMLLEEAVLMNRAEIRF